MSDTENKRLADPQYWNDRYANVGPDEQVHEWFQSFEALEPFLNDHLFQIYKPDNAPKILHLGSGDSTIPQDLALREYQNQLCVDFSSVVVQSMSQKHSSIKGIVWKQLDVRHMDPVQSESIDVAFDKGTLDAMIHGSPWSPPDDVIQNTSRYINEVFRVLKSDGRFVYITYRQPHFIKPLLNCKGTSWDINLHELGGSGSFGYYGYVLRKSTPATVNGTS